ncbi:hypothetical protein Tco_0273288 [Tanacetum coccineum]
MTGNLKLLINFFWKFLRTVRFGNDHVAAILDLEVAFREENTVSLGNLEGCLLKGNRTTNLYTINLYEMASASPICLMARDTSTKSWLWHQLLAFSQASSIKKTINNWSLLVGLREIGEQNDREDIGKLGAKGDIGFFIGYSAFAICRFEQSSSKLGLQSMTSGQISSGLDLTYAPSTIKTQQPTKHELDLLFEAMYDDYIGGQPSAATRTAPAAQAPQVLQTPTASTTTANTVPTLTNSSSQATNIPNTSHDVDELEQQRQHVQQQDNQAPL